MSDQLGYCPLPSELDERGELQNKFDALKVDMSMTLMTYTHEDDSGILYHFGYQILHNNNGEASGIRVHHPELFARLRYLKNHSERDALVSKLTCNILIEGDNLFLLNERDILAAAHDDEQSRGGVIIDDQYLEEMKKAAVNIARIGRGQE